MNKTEEDVERQEEERLNRTPIPYWRCSTSTYIQSRLIIQKQNVCLSVWAAASTQGGKKKKARCSCCLMKFPFSVRLLDHWRARKEQSTSRRLNKQQSTQQRERDRWVGGELNIKWRWRWWRGNGEVRAGWADPKWDYVGEWDDREKRWWLLTESVKIISSLSLFHPLFPSWTVVQFTFSLRKFKSFKSEDVKKIGSILLLLSSWTLWRN